MARAHQALAVDESVGDPAAVVRALVGDHDQPPAAQPRDRDPPGADPRRQDGPGRQVAGQPAARGAGRPGQLGQANIRIVRINTESATRPSATTLRTASA